MTAGTPGTPGRAARVRAVRTRSATARITPEQPAEQPAEQPVEGDGAAAGATPGTPQSPEPRPARVLPTLPDASAAQEIRDTLDDLRRVLDDVTASAPPPRRRRRAAPLGAAGRAVRAAVALGVAVATRGTDEEPADAPSAAAPVAPAAPSPSASSTGPTGGPSARPSAVRGVLSGPLPAFPGADGPSPDALPTTGPGADAPGSLVVVTLAGGPRDATVAQVYEQVVVAAGGDVRLVPPEVSGLGGVLRGTALAADGLTAAVDGAPARVEAARGSGWVVPDVPAGATLALRYSLSGAVLPAPSNVPGRAYVALAGLAAAPGTPVQAALVGSPTLTVLCPGLAAAEQLCALASSRPLPWLARVPAGAPAPVALALADLG